MSQTENWLTIGKIVAAQGLQGQIRVNPSTDFPERFTKAGKRWISTMKGSPPKVIELISGRLIPGKSLYVVKLAGINNRDQAESLIGKSLLVPTGNRPKLAPNEFHFLDLIGLKVCLNKHEASIGEVKGLESAGNDLLEVELLNGKKVLIPFVKEIVPEVNLKEGWLKLTPPKGLLDL